MSLGPFCGAVFYPWVHGVSPFFFSFYFIGCSGVLSNGADFVFFSVTVSLGIN